MLCVCIAAFRITDQFTYVHVVYGIAAAKRDLMQFVLRFSSSKSLKCPLHSNSYTQRNGLSVTVCCKASEILN